MTGRRLPSPLWGAALSALVVLVGGAGASTERTSVVNAGFEEPSDSGCLQRYTAGTSLGGWTVGGAGVDHAHLIRPSCAWPAIEGSYSVDLNADGAGSVSQGVDTEPGRTYQLHFAFAGNPEGPPRLKRMTVRFGAFERKAEYDGRGDTRYQLGWICPTYRVTASSSTTGLSFVSTTGSDQRPSPFGPVVDDVRLLDADAVTVIRASPDGLPAGSDRRLVKVRGTNFMPGARVSIPGFGVTVHSTRFVDPTTLEATISVAGGTPRKLRVVVVTNPDAGRDVCASFRILR